MPAAPILLLTAVLTLGAAGQAQAEVVWTADATRPVHEEWASFSTRDRCAEVIEPGTRTSRISQVDAPPGAPTPRAYRFELRDGDMCFGGERAELAQRNPGKDFPDGVSRQWRRGEERWIAFWLRFEPGYILDRGGRGHFHSLAQFKQAGGHGSPVLSLGLREGRFEVSRTGNNPRTRWEDFPPAWLFGSPRTGVVYRFTWHVKFDPDPDDGFVEVFADLADGRGMRTVVPFTREATMKIADGSDPRHRRRSVLPSHLRIGPYRDDDTYDERTVSHYGGVTVATTRREAERSAFGGR
jgi:hypothetical protein